MKICFPVEQNLGLSSAVYGHFGSAPGFVVVDSVTGACSAIVNGDRIHQHGACNPVAGLAGHEVDAVVVGGIGGGALHKLNAAGMRVFRALAGTVADNLALFRANQLQEYLPGHTCGGHSHGHGCSH
ncbi:NifB/NifX family molybdenum-iron cluster-binding protein [Geomonas subterranea]|uniref:Diguanylate cyclase n=1 Tax=Geomonas subterranea TaxID=2847989 RepID=A0ABX8LEB6_9BACT|nr:MULTISPECIES: NifB/NifX family molybdenum-iron cluster-binding protein [Geomonas]QXE90073.1 diguanylate cyclase [Geomonas subterranea]QXM07805.1 diguanylate cyclase [Geomonas subterranea]